MVSQYCPVPNDMSMNDPVNLYRVWVNRLGKKRPIEILAHDSLEAEQKIESMGYTIYPFETRLSTLHHSLIGYCGMRHGWAELRKIASF